MFTEGTRNIEDIALLINSQAVGTKGRKAGSGKQRVVGDGLYLRYLRVGDIFYLENCALKGIRKVEITGAVKDHGVGSCSVVTENDLVLTDVGINNCSLSWRTWVRDSNYVFHFAFKFSVNTLNS